MIREIDPRLVALFDARLQTNGLAQLALKNREARILMRMAAQACVGILEHGGNNRGPEVELFQETIGGHSRESWCMSFIQSCIAYAEVKTGVNSPIIGGEHCLTVWAQSPHEQRVHTYPLPGAIAIFQHGTSQNGHCGIIESMEGVDMWTYEGNTEHGIAPNGAMVRDGGGVYHCLRSFNMPMGDMHLVGCLKPF